MKFTFFVKKNVNLGLKRGKFTFFLTSFAKGGPLSEFSMGSRIRNFRMFIAL